MTENSEYDVPGVELLKRLGLMQFKGTLRHDYFMSVLVFKGVNSTTPFHLCDALI